MKCYKRRYDYATIRGILRVTPSTISHVSMQLKYAGKGYKPVVQKILKGEKIDLFWQKIEEIITSIPPSKGTNLIRWRKEREMRKRSLENPF